jgi:hypothetical protein
LIAARCQEEESTATGSCACAAQRQSSIIKCAVIIGPHSDSRLFMVYSSSFSEKVSRVIPFVSRVRNNLTKLRILMILNLLLFDPK